MSDVQPNNPTPTPTPIPANTPEARNPDGSIKDLQSTPAPEKSATTPEGEVKPGAKKDEPVAPVIPEKYDFKAPEGFELSQTVIDEATPILKELKIDQAGADKLFDIFSKHAAKTSTDMIAAYETTRTDWRKEISTDREIGNGKDGLSPKASENIAAVINSLPAAQATAFKDAMNLTGAGDNPAFVRALSSIGAALREGTHVSGGKPSPNGQANPGAAKPTRAQAFYPNLPSSNSAS